MIDHYTLIGQTPVPCDPFDLHTPEGIAGLIEWARWGEIPGNRNVAFTRILGICYVSTVFLGLDTGFGRGRPILFESMTFWSGDGGNEQDRCCTWAEAEAMHARMVAEVSRPGAVWSYLCRMLRKTWEDARRDWARRWRELLELGPKRSGDPLYDNALESMESMRESMSQQENRDWMVYG